MSSEATRTIHEKIAAWASRLRADRAVGHLWTRTAVREAGTSGASPALVEVSHESAETPATIADAIAAAVCDVLDVDDKPRTAMLYPLDSEGTALRQGFAVRVAPSDHRATLASHPSVPRAGAIDEGTRLAMLRDSATAHVLGSTRAHAEMLRAHMAEALAANHSMMQAVTSSLTTSQRFAAEAIEAARARAVAAEAAEAKATRERDDARTERDKALAQCEEALDIIKRLDDADERRSGLLELLTPILTGAGIRLGAWAQRRANGTPRRPPVDAVDSQADGPKGDA